MVEELRTAARAYERVLRIRHPTVLAEMLDYRLYLVYRDCGYVTEGICRREFGISRRRLRIIFTLIDAEGVTVSELAKRADLDIAQTSRTIGTMVREGFLRRRSNPQNARFAQIWLTEKGRELYRDILGRYRQANNRLLDVLNDEEVIQLDRMIDKLRRHAAVVDAEVKVTPAHEAFAEHT